MDTPFRYSIKDHHISTLVNCDLEKLFEYAIDFEDLKN